ncbi:MAG: ABC transporter ATP-binding protein [Candidatus Omnitrophica bacterium]|nr:ABC transporter ATP-binding protein [Candidatus Omnitrophota bacterium]
MSDVLEVRGVGKAYPDGRKRLEILKDITFSVRKGEGVAILGPSGSGKTTLLNIVSGLDRPTSGKVHLLGSDIHRLPESCRAELRAKKIGFVFQFYHLLSEFSALENVMFPALIHGDRQVRRAARQKASSLLERVGLGHRLTHFPTELSGGEQQRTAIARALMNDPDILFCDEPTGNLDPVSGTGVAELLRDFFVKEAKTVLIVTHDERIARMAHRVWDIVTGKWK